MYGRTHPFMVKGRRRQRIPNPQDKDIGVELLSEILRQAQISSDEWEKA